MRLCNIKLLPAWSIPVAACSYSLFVSLCIQASSAPWQTAVMASRGWWAEFLASSHISAPITEQSARPDSLLSVAASPIPLLPSSAVWFHLSAICFLPQLLRRIKKKRTLFAATLITFPVLLAFKGFIILYAVFSILSVLLVCFKSLEKPLHLKCERLIRPRCTERGSGPRHCFRTYYVAQFPWRTMQSDLGRPINLNNVRVDVNVA